MKRRQFTGAVGVVGAMLQHLGYAAWSKDGAPWHSPIMLEGTLASGLWKGW